MWFSQVIIRASLYLMLNLYLSILTLKKGIWKRCQPKRQSMSHMSVIRFKKTLNTSSRIWAAPIPIKCATIRGKRPQMNRQAFTSRTKSFMIKRISRQRATRIHLISCQPPKVTCTDLSTTSGRMKQIARLFCTRKSLRDTVFILAQWLSMPKKSIEHFLDILCIKIISTVYFSYTVAAKQTVLRWNYLILLNFT